MQARICCRRLVTVVSLAVLSAVGPVTARADQAPDPAQMAQRLDQQLQAELPQYASVEAGRCNDETFCRRVTLDVAGRLPTVEELSLFALDPGSDKRRELVRQLLASPEYGRRWGRYWRDVVFYRSSDVRALRAAGAFEDFMADRLNRNEPWDRIVREILTATGEIHLDGATGLIMAQLGEPEPVAAEVSRIFLGIQIQCAQCHDHPTDRWKREQFHHLAAFFPRVRVRPVAAAGGRSFLVMSVDRPLRLRGRRVKIEHFMPDLDDPQAPGKLMRPEFFLTGQSLPVGTPDQQRRRRLADWMTSKQNPWFAKALVNRMWHELVGRGFYEPVDDMGPDRQPTAPKTLELLAQGFRDADYNLKWLVETICLTQAYQQAVHNPQSSQSEEVPFARGCPTRLRPDQLLTTLQQVLLVELQATPRRRGGFNARAAQRRFSLTFGFDPSVSQDQIEGSIPQALFLMNSPITRAMTARPGSMLAQLLRQYPDDAEAVEELYLRCLARRPRQSEKQKALAYIRRVGDRAEAFEDLLWVLVNSTEFLYRR